MGVRLAYSQAHRPQANGRAEVCGRIIHSSLRKMHVQEGVNWVEALPRVLRLHHDMVNEYGVSPYKLVFGRERNMAGIPWQPVHECRDAEEFLDQMRALDTKLAEALNAAHARVAQERNKRRQVKNPLKKGTWVWLLKPRQVGGFKAERWWRGPYQIVQRTGVNSYQVHTERGTAYDVHRDQLKICNWDTSLGEGVPLAFRQSDPTDQLEKHPVVDRVMGHRHHPTRGLEFLTHWAGTGDDEVAWEPVAAFIHGCSEAWLQYCSLAGISMDLKAIVGSRGKPWDVWIGPGSE
jgi:hypothetical protein